MVRPAGYEREAPARTSSLGAVKWYLALSSTLGGRDVVACGAACGAWREAAA